MSTVTELSRPTRVRRAFAVALAAVLGLVIWAVADPLLGTDLAVRTGSGAAEQRIGAGSVLVTAVVAGLAGWALLALLERVTPRAAARTWRVVAAVALAVSLLGPLAAVGTATTLTLLCLHVAVGVTLIVALPANESR